MLTVLTAMSGNLLGSIPVGLFWKALFGLLCLFQLTCVVLLVLVYSVSVDADVIRIRKALAGTSTKSREALVLGFERLLSRVESGHTTSTITPSVCQFMIDGKHDWQTFDQIKVLQKSDAALSACRIKTVIPIRPNAILTDLEIAFVKPPISAPTLDTKQANQKSDCRFVANDVGSGFCTLEFDFDIPENIDETIAAVAVTYNELLINEKALPLSPLKSSAYVAGVKDAEAGSLNRAMEQDVDSG